MDPNTITSPEMHGDGSITLRLYAPQAESVALVGELANLGARDSWPMEQDSDGVWLVTISGMRPGTYYYNFEVDGSVAMDCRNPAVKLGVIRHSGLAHIPGAETAFSQAADVPHGRLEMNWYRSTILGQTRRLIVFTPPGYDAVAGKKYPVLYLRHGMGDTETGWSDTGRANFILDDLIAAGRSRPMVVVMAFGHVYRDRRIERLENNRQIEQDLFRHILPYVQTRYRVQDGPEHRAIAGLSMGGGQALTFGLQHLDTFGWVGAFSPSIAERRYGPYEETFSELIADPARANERLGLLWIRCGTKDHLFGDSEEFTKFLRKHAIEHFYKAVEFESLWPGRLDDHVWPAWRLDLNDFAQLLFQ